MGLLSRIRSIGGERRPSKSPTSTIVIPLYQYPKTSATWKPLYDAIASNPNLQFLVIVNPNSGPGDAPWWPNVDYLREIPKLNALPNVTTVGYIRIDYCNRDLADVLAEVRRYAKWPHDTGVRYLHVEGIFVDESPNEHSSFKATYLDKITHEVKSADGILGDKLVIHNPGTMPDAELMRKEPDITVVFEQSHARLLEDVGKQALGGCERAKTCYMVHSVPRETIKSMTHEARYRASYVFVTDLDERFYERFGADWQVFIDSMAANY